MILRLTLRKLLLGLVVASAVHADRAAFATAGLAEWEISTPGGNRISHIDPLKERYGTCLRKADDQPGVILDDPSRVYVDHLEWWQFYPHHVTGLGRQGLFIFDESAARTEYFKSEQDLAREIKRRALGEAVSQRRTPADGWNETWTPVIRERCAELMKQAATESAGSDATKDAIRKYCNQVR